MQALETSTQAAITDAGSVSARLDHLAGQHRARHREVGTPQTIKHLEPSAGTFCYQTHVAIDGQAPSRLDWLANIFFNAATMGSQPWYPQFLSGEAMPLTEPVQGGILQHHLTLGCFDLGLPAPRYYRQLVSMADTGHTTRVIIARSVNQGPSLPAGGKLAYTLDPNGEVLHYENGRLHWHHICCTPGAGVLPGRLDRWLINALRRSGLDRAERNTYRAEAELLRDWLQQTKTPAEPLRPETARE